jgi:hypothetical protein
MWYQTKFDYNIFADEDIKDAIKSCKEDIKSNEDRGSERLIKHYCYGLRHNLFTKEKEVEKYLHNNKCLLNCNKTIPKNTIKQCINYINTVKEYQCTNDYEYKMLMDVIHYDIINNYKQIISIEVLIKEYELKQIYSDKIIRVGEKYFRSDKFMKNFRFLTNDFEFLPDIVLNYNDFYIMKNYDIPFHNGLAKKRNVNVFHFPDKLKILMDDKIYTGSEMKKKVYNKEKGFEHYQGHYKEIDKYVPIEFSAGRSGEMMAFDNGQIYDFDSIRIYKFKNCVTDVTFSIFKYNVPDNITNNEIIGNFPNKLYIEKDRCFYTNIDENAYKFLCEMYPDKKEEITEFYELHGI